MLAGRSRRLDPLRSLVAAALFQTTKPLTLAQPKKRCQCIERQGFAPLSLCYDSARVRILIDYRPALRHRSGVGEYVDGLATALQARLPKQDSLTIFSSSWRDRLPADAVPGARRVDARVPVRVLNYVWYRLEWPPVEWLAGPLDVAHSLHPLMIPSRGAARVVTVHDLFFLDFPEGSAREIRRDYGALAADHARRADAIVVISEYTRRQVVDRFQVDPERVFVCLPAAPAWRRREEPAVPGPILFVGTIEPRKNLPGLLRAYSELVRRRPDSPDLVLAGRLPPEGAGALRLKEPGLAGRVRSIGYVTDAERQRLYREASMLVVPSFDEGFGLPALEAMTLGVPVVAARRGALPEVVGDAGLLVEIDDPGPLAAAMELVLTDAGTRRRLADAGVRRSARFVWDTSAARLQDAYIAAVARRHSAGERA
jgi:glycosyltransferase involved in cell wall biosynthesis